MLNGKSETCCNSYGSSREVFQFSAKRHACVKAGYISMSKVVTLVRRCVAVFENAMIVQKSAERSSTNLSSKATDFHKG